MQRRQYLVGNHAIVGETVGHNLDASNPRSDDEGGIMTTLGFQSNATPNTWPMIFDTPVLSMKSNIFHHSEPFVKMWHESLFHSCH